MEHNCCGYTANLRDNSPFTEAETGVYGDGAFGSFHTTAKAVRLAHQFGMDMNEDEHRALLDADTNNGYGIEEWDALDEWHGLTDQAVEYLNEHAVEDGLYFEFHEGDFRLSNHDDDEEF